MKLKALILDIISLLFILLWVYAAMNKLLDYQKFVVQLTQSPLLTELARPIAWIIPAVELLIAAALVFTRSRYAGFVASFSLMILFTSYIVAITRFSYHVPCSCGGILEKLSWTAHLRFNIVFILLALLAILLSGTSPGMRYSILNKISIS